MHASYDRRKPPPKLNSTTEIDCVCDVLRAMASNLDCVDELTRILTLNRLSLAQLALTMCVPAAVAVFTDPSALEPLAQLRLEETCRGPALSFPMGKPTVYSIALATSPRTA